MEKPTTDNLKALGYKLVRSAIRDGYIVMRPGGRVVPDSYAMSPAKAWAVAREFIAREIAATQGKP